MSTATTKTGLEIQSYYIIIYLFPYLFFDLSCFCLFFVLFLHIH